MQDAGSGLDLSVVMPCRDEAEAIASCIREAKSFIDAKGLKGEIIVADNASTDGSGEIAAAEGAVVVYEPSPGYGNALKAGFKAARGRIIIMGDADMTYDFSQMGRLYGPIAEGSCDMMIGDRFAGGIEKGAMPLSHHLGVRALSAFGRMLYRTDVRDFHCGLRGFRRDLLDKLELESSGMEFATEMIAKAARKGLRIGQAPVRLRRCSVQRSSKLRTIRDGIRHLRFMIEI